MESICYNMLLDMENLLVAIFLIFLATTIVVFKFPSIILKNKTEPVIKKTKLVLVVLTVLSFVLFGVTSDASKKNISQNNQITVTTTPQSTPTPTKKITYEVVKTWIIPNGGFGKVIVISPEYFNLSDMTLLGEKLKNDHKADRNSFIYIFDDKKAAIMRDKVLSNDISTTDQDYYDKHYLGDYTKNSNSGYHQLTIYFDGVTGTNQKTIKY